MVLQTLQEGVNLHRANFTFERTPMVTMAELKARYDELKGTFWNPNKGWAMSLPEQTILISYCSGEQLIGVLVERLFSPEAAKAHLASVRNSFSEAGVALIEGAPSIWKGGEKGITSANAGLQLFGIFASQQCADTEHEREYRALRESVLWNRDTKLWNHSVWTCAGGKPEISRTHHTEIQLLGILVEHFYSPERAREQYEALKQPKFGFWDSNNSIWRHFDGSRQSGYYINVQLLSVLVEQLFSPSNAIRDFEELKRSPSWDAAIGRWNHFVISPDKIGNSSIRSYDQLLGIFVEAKLIEAEERARKLDAGAVALPDRRRF